MLKQMGNIDPICFQCIANILGKVQKRENLEGAYVR